MSDMLCVYDLLKFMDTQQKKEIKLNILSIMRSDSSKYSILWYKK